MRVDSRPTGRADGVPLCHRPYGSGKPRWLFGGTSPSSKLLALAVLVGGKGFPPGKQIREQEAPPPSVSAMGWPCVPHNNCWTVPHPPSLRRPWQRWRRGLRFAPGPCPPLAGWVRCRPCFVRVWKEWVAVRSGGEVNGSSQVLFSVLFGEVLFESHGDYRRL